MSKLSVIRTLTNMRTELDESLSCIREMEVNRVYMFRMAGKYETYGVLEAFNKQSMRFRILASNEKDVFRNDNLTTHKRGDLRHNVASMGYMTIYTRVKKEDIITLLGMEFTSDELARIFNGTSKEKYLWD